jgi:hypothetical protein
MATRNFSLITMIIIALVKISSNERASTDQIVWSNFPELSSVFGVGMFSHPQTK